MISKEDLDRLYLVVDEGFISRRTGRMVGSKNEKGYLRVTIRGKKYRIHRLMYFYHKGRWPDLVDHIDQDKTNNRIENLREVSPSLNKANSDKCYNQNGYRGVFADSCGKFRSEVCRNGLRMKSKRFDTAEEAHEEYLKMRAKVYPELFT